MSEFKTDIERLTAPPSGSCEHCDLRPATAWWSDAASILEINRGAPIFGWCAICINDAQIVHARKQLQALPVQFVKLEAERAQILSSPSLAPVLPAPAEQIEMEESTFDQDGFGYADRHTELTADPKMNLLLDLLKLSKDFPQLTADLWWRTDREYAPVTVWVNVNDVFEWACADSEEIRHEDLRALESALQTCATLKGFV